MSLKNIEDAYPLSPMQQGMLFHSLCAPESGVYVEQARFDLHGDLNIPAFTQAWQQLISRHSVLRTAFVWENLDNPVQIVGRQVKFPWEMQDWRDISIANQSLKLEELRETDRRQGFDLSQAPLMRLILIHLTETTYHFIWNHHHLLLDGWSVHLLYQELVRIYRAYCQGEPISLKQPRPYRDYIAWLQEQDVSQAEVFWRRLLKGFTSPTRLWIEQPSYQFLGFESDINTQEIRLSGDTTSALQEFARRHHLTLNTVVQAAWCLLLNHYTGEDDVVFGMTGSGRPPNLADIDAMVGLFINTLPMRVRIVPEESLLPWLRRLQAQQVEVRQYEYSSLIDIHAWSELPRETPLFETILVFENYPVRAVIKELNQNLAIQKVDVVEKTNYPLNLLVGVGSDLSLKLLYDNSRFASGAIAHFLQHMQMLLEAITANPQQRLCDLPHLTQAEQQRLLVEWNTTQVDYPQHPCLHEWFEVQVERTPDAVALVFEDQQLTYQELNARSNQLAHYLQSLGIGPETLVGVCLERSVELVIALLAVLKAGGAYVPLDPTYPKERLAFILEDTQLPVLLTHSHLVEHFPPTSAQVVDLVAAWSSLLQESSSPPQNSCLSSQQPAYVIYTSGSTGIPKGVIGSHQGILNRFHWMWETYPFAPGETCCQKTALSFVDSVWELFGPLVQGVRTLLVPEAVVTDPAQLIRLLAQQQVTRLVLVPSLLRALLETAPALQTQLPQLRLWVTSGEALSVEVVQQFWQALPQSRLLNLYGASEVAADVTAYELQPTDETPVSIPIGRPIANTQVYVLDGTGQPVPVGVPGELHIGGIQLARGYYQRPELTAERFLPHPFSADPGARLYKTGDLVRYRADGMLEYLGRLDHQVKIRGFRIELGEIESVLAQHPEVSQAVVIACTNDQGGQQLLGYYVPAHPEVSPSMAELRSFLRDKLPEYMVPGAIVELEALPLTPNGKVDRRALAKLNPSPDLEEVYQAPTTELEKTIAEIWQGALQLEKVGIHNNFFDIGGHSLLVVAIHSKLQQRLRREFPVVVLFQHPTVSTLAQYLSQAAGQQISAQKTRPSGQDGKASIRRQKQLRQQYREAVSRKR